MGSDSWWRFYNTAMDHPKVLRLNDWQFRGWIGFNSLASKLGGVVPDDMALIAASVRMTVTRARELIQVLLGVVLIDRVDGGYTPHNWNEKQFKSDVSTERVKRFRNARRNVNETDHRQSTETETEKNKDSARASRFAEFWESCRRKVGKPYAKKIYERLEQKVGADVLIAGMKRYSASQQGKDIAYVLHPATWLNRGMWEDEAEAPASNVLQFKLTPEEQAAEDEILNRFKAQGLIP